VTSYEAVVNIFCLGVMEAFIISPQNTTCVRVNSLSLVERCIMLVDNKLTLLLEWRIKANKNVQSLHPVIAAH
jgi:hypothetical protein